MVTDVVTNPYRGIAELLSIGFCARNTDSNPRCLINSEKRHSYEWRFFVRKNICKAAINAGVVGRMKQHGNVKSDGKSKEK